MLSVSGLWMLAGLREVRLGLPERVYRSEDTTAHKALTPHTHPVPRPAGLPARGAEAARARRKRSAGKVALPSRRARLSRGRLRSLGRPRRRAPQLPRKDVPGAPMATRRLPPRLQASEWGEGSAGDKEAREPGEAGGALRSAAGPLRARRTLLTPARASARRLGSLR